jgi:hypothetical protein
MHLHWAGGFQTLVHEWGHYAVSASDEYEYYDEVIGNIAKSQCTADKHLHDIAMRASIMDHEGEATEFCGDNNHNVETEQHQVNGQSVWATLFANWNGHGAMLHTPMSRRTVNPGPTSLPCFIRLNPSIGHSPFVACPPNPLTILTPGSPSGTGFTATPLDVTLRHGNRSIPQGIVGPGKTLNIYGAVPGDLIYASKTEPQPINGEIYTTSGEATVSGCGEPVTITTETWPSSSLIPMPWVDADTNEFAVFLNTRGAQPVVRATLDQDGQRRQEMKLTFDERLGGYMGRYPIQRNVASNFTLVLEMGNEGGAKAHTSYRYSAALFQSAGNPFWKLFPPHYPVNLVGKARLLPERTAVLAGTTPIPAALPEGLIVVGGPYSVRAGEDGAALASPTAWTFLYETNLASGIDPKSIVVHRYEQGKWLPLRTTVDPEHGEAHTTSDQWGIYAVFARLSR